MPVLTEWRNRITGQGVKPASEFLANPKNWRTHPPAQRNALKGVLSEVGWVQQVIENTRSGFLIDGHERIWSALQNGDTEVPFLTVDLSPEEEALILATLDPIGAMAQADTSKLDELLRDVSTGDAAVQAMLAELAEASGLDYGKAEVAEDPGAQVDRAAELQEKWGTASGQLWTIESKSVPSKAHRLLCGDSTSAEDVARLMGGERANMVFADPPYGISIVAANGYVGGGEAYDIPFGGVKNRKGLGTANGSKPFGSKDVRGTDGASHVVEAGKYLPVRGDETTQTAITAYSFLSQLWPRAVQIWWGGNYYANALPPSSCWLVWDKETTGNFADCELAWTNQPTAVRRFKHQWNGMLRESERERRVHPTQKPVALAVWCFEQYGQAGDLIADPFCGAGMSLLAAEQTNRIAYGVEWEAGYIAVALERLAGMGLEPRLAEARQEAAV